MFPTLKTEKMIFTIWGMFLIAAHNPAGIKAN